MNKGMKKSIVITILVVMLLAVTVPVAFASGGNYHTVYYGETLYSIGRHYGVNPYYIADANNLYDPDHIYVGQTLYIPMSGKWDDCDCNKDHHSDYQVDYDHGYDNNYGDNYDNGYNNDHGRNNHHDRGNKYGHDRDHGYNYDSNYHVVRRGETLSSIAYRYGVSPWALAEANHIYNLHRIYAGEVLYIPTDNNNHYDNNSHMY